MNQIKEEYKIIYEIFTNLFQNCTKNINIENQDELNDNNSYVDLNKIEGNIDIINIEKLNVIINRKDNIKNNMEEINNKMVIEDDLINDALNKDIRNDYKNYNSIII